MELPMRAQILNRESECPVHVTDKNTGLVLAAIRVQGVTMAKAMGVVVADHRHPISFVQRLKLHGKPNNAVLDPLKRTTDLCLIRSDPDEPRPRTRLRAVHK